MDLQNFYGGGMGAGGQIKLQFLLFERTLHGHVNQFLKYKHLQALQILSQKYIFWLIFSIFTWSVVTLRWFIPLQAKRVGR